MFEAMKSMNEVHSVGFKFGVEFGYTYLILDFGSWQLLRGCYKNMPHPRFGVTSYQLGLLH